MLYTRSLKLGLVLAVAGTGFSTIAQAARDYISIVGSSTVYPFATVVAEHFGKSRGLKTPKIEATGTGGGMKLFCAGVGVEHPDIANASRRMKDSEFAQCQKNGVSEVVEVKIGYDGIAIANSKKSPPLTISLKDVFLALAKEVPDPSGAEKLVPNPYKTWKEVNSALPDAKIEVLGPPPTSGTRDAFAEMALEGGCKSFGWIKAINESDGDKFKAICHTVREDGAYIEAGENDNLIVQKVEANPNALGVFGFSFLDQNTDKVQASVVEGVAPEFETISDGSYPISRPLYIYVKKGHVDVIPGIKEFLAEFTSEKAWGEEGYLADKGLIPMPAAEREQFTADAKGLKGMSLSQL
ncbi:MAG: PstS family phosphate ABC transporter substrate-binding protein [Gammaproteobacteria bacterium]